MFYDKELNILGYSEGITNDYGLYVEGTETVVRSFKCDVQPYSKDLLYKDYGYTEEVTQRVFCDVDSSIETGTIVKDKQNKKYKVMRIILWDDYMELMINDE